MTNNHRDILRSLSGDEKRQLTALANLPGILHLAGHLGIIAGFAALNFTLDGGWQIAAMVGQGAAMVFLFTAMHECSHKTAFKTGWVNGFVGTVVGLVLFLLPKWFFYFHQDHHKYTQDPERDPELANEKPSSISAYLIYLSGIAVWRDHLWALVKIIAGRQDDLFVPKAAKASVRRQAFVFAAIYIVVLPVLWNAGWLIQFWLLPLLLGQPFLRLYLLAEHADCAHSEDMLVNTRTIITNPLVLFIAWNMPYHSEHHSFTAVPFHRLPQFHRILEGHHGVLTRGYASFHRQFLKRIGV